MRFWSRTSAGAALLVAVSACSADHAKEPLPEIETPGAVFASPQEDGSFQLAQTLAELPVTATESAFFVKTFHNRASSVEDAERICREEPLRLRSDVTFVAASVLEEATVVWFITLTREDLDAIQ
jgi:hypothetical protein